MSYTDRENAVTAMEIAKREAFPPGQYIHQESFVDAQEVETLVSQAGVKKTTRVLDLCCGVGGPAIHIAKVSGCDLVGVDRDPGAVLLANRRASEAGVKAEFLVSEVPPALSSTFEVVTFFETVLAFPDKEALFTSVAQLLEVRGRLVMTYEEGSGLTKSERATMPESSTVCLIPQVAMNQVLGACGFRPLYTQNLTSAHARVAEKLWSGYSQHRASLERAMGAKGTARLIDSHRLWADWLTSGRVRKFGVVAQLEEA